MNAKDRLEAGQFWKTVQQKSKAQNESPVLIATIKSVKPLIFEFNGIERGQQFGDTVYINHLLFDENINLDLASMDEIQNLTGFDPAPLVAHVVSNSDYQAFISGTQKTFLTDFYNWFKNWHDRYILHIGDFVAVQKLGNNAYIILQKVQTYGA